MSSTLRRLLLLALLARALTPVSAPPAAVAFAQHKTLTAAPTVNLLADGLRVAWRAPLPDFTAQADGWTVSMPGFDNLREPAVPRLPVASILIALPPDASPEILIEEVEEHVVMAPGPLALAPRPGENGLLEAVAASDALPFERAILELTPLGVLRGVSLARLTFYPARPVGAELVLTTRVRAIVRFNAPGTVTASAGFDPLVEVVRNSVANPAQVQAVFRAAPAEVAAFTHTNATAPRAFVEVTQSGVTALTYDALNAAGFPVASVNPANLQLSRAGSPVALEWLGDDDAVFEPDERFLFYAEPRFDRYTSGDVYLLSDINSAGLRMSRRSASPDGLPAGNAWVEQTFEANQIYTPECFCPVIPAGRDGERWVWERVFRFTSGAQVISQTFQTNFALTNLHLAQPTTLTVWLIGKTDVPLPLDHRVNIVVNGVTRATPEWNGKQAVTTTVPLGPGVLQVSNTLALSLPGIEGVTVEEMWLDAFAVRHALGAASVGTRAAFTGEAVASRYALTFDSTVGLRAYDITVPDQPVALSGLSIAGNSVSFGDAGVSGPRRYALTAESGMRTPARVRVPQSLAPTAGADYVVITHRDFRLALDPLLALRQSQGLSVAVEDVAAIYDALDGRPTAEAIRAYLATAYATWNPRPAYVLLVGDGVFDLRRYQPDSLPTFIPPYLADVDPFTDETAADNRYVAVQGNDALPDMALGRLPVNSLAEAQAVVSKIVQAETNPAPGAWNSVVAFLSDNADEAGNFPATSQAMAATYIAPPFTAQQLLVSQPITPTYQAVLARWNAGAGLMLYNGHASVRQLAAERAFHADDVAGLTNAGRLPVALHMTCFTGMYHLRTGTGLDERLVRQPNSGAVAVWGSTSLGVANGHDELANGFLQALFVQRQPMIGAAALAGKARLAGSQVSGQDLLDTFNLLGDPASRFNLVVSPGFPVYLPLIRR